MAWINKLALILGSLSVGYVVYWYFTPFQVDETSKVNADAISSRAVTIMRVVHLLVFANSFGTQLWVSFFGGVIMFRNLPRHQFGNLQAKMFPVYFQMGSLCAAINIAVLGTLHPHPNSSEQRAQLSLFTTLFCNLINLLVLEPITTKVMRDRYRIEREENIGNEVGLSKNKEIAQHNSELAKINKKFGMVHGFSSLANLLGFFASIYHGLYLAQVLTL